MTDDAETELKPGRPGAGRHDPAARPCVYVLSGDTAGTVVQLAAGTSKIGRGAAAAVRLDDNGVSRDHAKLVVGEDGIVNLVDLQSTNGTFVNGAPVDMTVVRDGDRIQIGPDVTLLFSYMTQHAIERIERGDAVDRPAVPEEPIPLSPREIEVAQLVAEGCTNTEIGRQLSISPRTVTTHLVKIYEKLGLHSRTALTRYVLERGLLRSRS